MVASVPERCPQCHSPVAERFPHVVMYDCGLSVFNGGEPVTDDYPAECQRRRIKRLEKQLAAARAEAERWRKKYEVLRAAVEDVADLLDRLRGAVEKARQLHCIDRDPYEDGRSVGWGTAVKWLRKALAEAGGGDQ